MNDSLKFMLEIPATIRPPSVRALPLPLPLPLLFINSLVQVIAGLGRRGMLEPTITRQ